MKKLRKAVRAHYVRTWGRPDRTAEFVDRAGMTVELYKWNASSTNEGVDLYATIGGCDTPARHDPRHRSEFVLGLCPGRDEVAPAFATLAKPPPVLGAGDTIRFESPLWPGAGMDCFLILRFKGDIIRPLQVRDGNHVEFLQAIPIFQSERAWKAAHGAELLMDNFEAAGVPFWDPARQPLAL